MRYLIIVLLLLIFGSSLQSRESGETEITAEDGIEVFQDEKYYLLKKNVKIVSDNFTLLGDIIKIYFNEDLYDIKIINATGNVRLESYEYNINARGNSLNLIVDTELIQIEGANSELITNDAEMYSDGKIEVNNIGGDFNLYGPNSELRTENVLIKGNMINGLMSNSNSKEILDINVKDDKISYVKNSETEMFAKKILYNKNNSLIELEDNVKIISNGEVITGDYGTLDTKTNSYKIKSKKTNKVKIIILDNNE